MPLHRYKKDQWECGLNTFHTNMHFHTMCRPFILREGKEKHVDKITRNPTFQKKPSHTLIIVKKKSVFTMCINAVVVACVHN